MKKVAVGIAIGILIIIIGGLIVRIGELKNTSQSQADSYTIQIQELQEEFQKEQDAIKLISLGLQDKADSIEAEYILQRAYVEALEQELAEKLEVVEDLPEEESYNKTQILLTYADTGDKDYGYSGGQVKVIHSSLIKVNYLDSIYLKQREIIETLDEAVWTKEWELSNNDYLISSLEAEVDSLANINDLVIEDLDRTTEDKNKYQLRSKVKNYAIVVLGTGVAILTYFNQKDERIN